MKGRSREAKGDKSTGGGRTWYEKQKTLTPCPPPPNSQESSLKDTISSYGPQNSHPLRYITNEKQQKRTGQLVEINICGTVVTRIPVLDQ